MKLKLGSLFDGIGGWPLAAIKYEINPVWAAEIESFPIEVTKKHFPSMKHLGDITAINGAEIEPVDIVCMGSPCFAAGTLILTKRGFVTIENVKIGDKVMTHTNSWHTVTETMIHGARKLYKLQAQGTLETIVTPEHPYYIRRMTKVWNNEKRCNERTFSDPVWTKVKDIGHGDFIGYPIIQTEENPINITKEEAWLIGRYVADGYIDDSQRKDRDTVQFNHKVILCIGKEKVEHFKKKVKEHHACYKEERTVIKAEIIDERLAGLCKLCSKHAENKEIPSFILNLPVDVLREFFNGYMSGDGCYKEKTEIYVATTVSRKLIFGLQAIVHKIYRTPCKLYFCKRPPTCIIEGRKVNQRDTYTIAFKIFIPKQSHAVVIDDHIWMPVSSCAEYADNIPVYNLTVDKDNSYTANGCIVHNCQDLSIAGKREGLAGARSGLFMDAVRIVREMREVTNGKYPRFVVWENVPGAFSSNKGNDFRAVLEEIAQNSIPMPESGRWAKAGMVRSNGCEVAWRTLDAQYWGVPQRRKRIFLVADFGGQRAAEILFKPESVCWYSAAGGSQGQRIAGNVESGIGAAGFKLGQGAKAHGIGWQKEIAPTLSAMDSGNKPAVAIWDMTHVNGVMRPVKDGIVPKLNTRMGTGGNQVTIVQEPIIINDKATRYKGGGDISGTLQPTVYSMGHDERSASFTPNKTDPLTASDYKQPVIANVGYKVRRLIPTECERLQGLPDEYTLLDDKKCSDSARYKALGNGMAQPCADFVIRRILEVLSR